MAVMPLSLSNALSYQHADVQKVVLELWNALTSITGGEVVGPSSAVNNDLVAFDGVTGKLVKDSGVLTANVVQGPASAISGDVVSYNGTTGKLVADSGKLASAVATGPASAVNNNLAVFDGTTGKLLKDGGVPTGITTTITTADLVGKTATFTNGVLVSFA